MWGRTQKIIEDQAETIAGLAVALVDGMAIVEQWGRAADTYEVVFTGPMLERMRAVRDIRLVGVGADGVEGGCSVLEIMKGSEVDSISPKRERSVPFWESSPLP